MRAAPKTAPGAAVYTRLTLPLYDLFVLGLCNRFVWACSTRHLLAHYNRHVAEQHLDVGVGTAYYLDHCRFPGATPQLSLLDLSPRSLEVTARRLNRYEPRVQQADVFQPLPTDEQFGSIGLTYLLHCLPGSMAEKRIIFERLGARLRPGGVLFGATILDEGVWHNPAGQGLMALYNRTGVFSNRHDGVEALRANLRMIGEDIEIEIRGRVAVFAVRAPA